MPCPTSASMSGSSFACSFMNTATMHEDMYTISKKRPLTKLMACMPLTTTLSNRESSLKVRKARSTRRIRSKRRVRNTETPESWLSPFFNRVGSIQASMVPKIVEPMSNGPHLSQKNFRPPARIRISNSIQKMTKKMLSMASKISGLTMPRPATSRSTPTKMVLSMITVPNNALPFCVSTKYGLFILDFSLVSLFSIVRSFFSTVDVVPGFLFAIDSSILSTRFWLRWARTPVLFEMYMGTSSSSLSSLDSLGADVSEASRRTGAAGQVRRAATASDG
mmetsp:Transcript_804/g.2027  ORF Transcript_804/g.2027 Transcript_804/m.2027 type:complete len:278 (+) Transcript_804:903-1736(+)